MQQEKRYLGQTLVSRDLQVGMYTVQNSGSDVGWVPHVGG